MQSDSWPVAPPDGGRWPKISVVTPSYNQEEFLEETIRSVILQGYPNLQYIVVDGKSTDGSAEILEKYDPWIDQWESEPDAGQSHAINKGFQRCTGEWGNWINSDDLLCQNALHHFPLSSLQPETLYVGDCLLVDTQNKSFKRHRGRVHTIEELIRIQEIWRSDGYIPQPSVLFPLKKYWESGGLNPLNHSTMDYELWGKMLLTGVQISYVGDEISRFRIYEEQKTANRKVTTESLVNSAERILKNSPSIEGDKERELESKLQRYMRAFRSGGEGRLVEWGVPPKATRKLRRAWSCLSSVLAS